MIREATGADVPRIVEMGQRFLTVTPYRDLMRGNPETMAATVTGLLATPQGLVLVAERDGALVGMIGVLIFPHHVSGEWTAGELFWWMEPGARGGGVRLLKRAEAWAHARGAVRMQMIAPDEQIGQMYARLGYAPIEVAYERVFDV